MQFDKPYYSIFEMIFTCVLWVSLLLGTMFGFHVLYARPDALEAASTCAQQPQERHLSIYYRTGMDTARICDVNASRDTMIIYNSKRFHFVYR